MKILALISFLFVPLSSWAEEVFAGIPLAKTVLSGEQLQRTLLDEDDQLEFRVVILKEGDRFFWKTREMKEVTRHRSGIFVTFQAVDGSGYVRVESSNAAMINLLGSPDITYIEHLKLGLNTITYQGRGSR
jgi:hypothetical protein